MATYTATLVPSSPTPTTLFSGPLTANTPFPVTTGFKTIIGITTSGTTDANAAAGVHVRFGSALKPPTAAAGDWFIPLGTVQYFDLGQEFDRISLMSAGTPNFYVYVFSTR